MKKYKHKITGKIVTEEDTFYYLESEGNLPKWLIENSSDWEEIVEYPVGTKVMDTNPETQGYTYEKQPNGKWKIGSQDYFTISEDSIGEGKRFQVIEESKKSYEILSYKYNGYIYEYTNNPYILIEKGKRHYEFEKGVLCESTLDLLGSKPTIHSVKRLSNSEVFTIGDEIEGKSGVICKIDYIELNPNCNQIMFNRLDEGIDLINAKKAKPVLFTTEDGVDIREGDEYLYIVVNDIHPNKWYPLETLADWDNPRKPPLGKVQFSTKEAAEKYIIMNKPCLSINDIKTLGGDLNNGAVCLRWNEVEELVKSKL